MFEGANCHCECHVATKTYRECRNAGAPVSRVGNDDHVRFQTISVLGEKVIERGRPEFLLALDENYESE